MTYDDTQHIEDRPSRDFPGGATRLPRISQARPGDPDVVFVESAFYREPREPWPLATTVQETGFGRYYSTASLFYTGDDAQDDPSSEAGPYSILGLTSHDSWEDISRAHRRLVSELHPDRYVGSEDVVREAAERRVRDVNEAYSEIRRERAGRGL